MASKTKIEWTDQTWNVVTGCDKVSPGCVNCYAERLAIWLQRFNPRYRNGFEVTLHPDKLEEPLHWKKPRLVFVNSMSDLFHEAIPEEFIHQAFDVMGDANEHIFQVLTKRSRRLADLAPDLKWQENIWMGVSVENKDYRWRVEDLRRVPASVRFLSLEPLLGPVHNLPVENIHWCICGGESGPRARPIKIKWVREIRDQCREAGIPFFLKQLGSNWSRFHHAHHSKGGDLKEWPTDLRVREYPQLMGEETK